MVLSCIKTIFKIASEQYFKILDPQLTDTPNEKDKHKSLFESECER